MPEYDVTSWSDVKCAYCGHKHRFEPEDMPWTDGEDKTFECSSCGEDFLCEAWVTTNWTTKERDE